MAQTFAMHSAMYKSTRHVGFSHSRLKPGDRMWAHALKAAQQAEEIGVDYDTYVRAQFYWFDQWFLKAPRFWEITSLKGRYNAVERVRAYQREVAAGKLDPKRVVTGRVRAAPKIPASVRLQQGARTLRALMATHRASEEQILRSFASGPQAALYFDQAFLKQNPTFQRLRAAGQI